MQVASEVRIDIKKIRVWIISGIIALNSISILSFHVNAAAKNYNSSEKEKEIIFSKKLSIKIMQIKKKFSSEENK